MASSHKDRTSANGKADHAAVERLARRAFARVDALKASEQAERLLRQADAEFTQEMEQSLSSAVNVFLNLTCAAFDNLLAARRSLAERVQAAKAPFSADEIKAVNDRAWPILELADEWVDTAKDLLARSVVAGAYAIGDVSTPDREFGPEDRLALQARDFVVQVRRVVGEDGEVSDQLAVDIIPTEYVTRLDPVA